jgi:hypothetical protein
MKNFEVKVFVEVAMPALYEGESEEEPRAEVTG